LIIEMLLFVERLCKITSNVIVKIFADGGQSDVIFSLLSLLFKRLLRASERRQKSHGNCSTE